MTIADPNEHVKQAERNNRTIKERVRATFWRLPLESVPKILIHKLVQVTQKINHVCPKGGASKEYSPNNMMMHERLDHNRHFKIPLSHDNIPTLMISSFPSLTFVPKTAFRLFNSSNGLRRTEKNRLSSRPPVWKDKIFFKIQKWRSHIRHVWSMVFWTAWFVSKMTWKECNLSKLTTLPGRTDSNYPVACWCGWKRRSCPWTDREEQWLCALGAKRLSVPMSPVDSSLHAKGSVK